MLCCIHCLSSNGNLCHSQQGAAWNNASVYSVLIHLLRSCTVPYIALHKSKSLKDVLNNITSVLQFFCKDRCTCNLKLQGAALMHKARRLHHPVFLYRAAQPAREKRHSQLRRMQSIESNLLTSSIACVSEQGGHLWRETKWLAWQQSTRWRHHILRREHDVGFCKTLYAHCKSMTKVSQWGAIAVVLWGTNGRFGWSWSCLQLIASFLVWTPHNSCSTNLSLWQASWRYRVSGDLSQKEVISLFCFFYFWIQLTFPHISQIAFWHKSQGNICRDLFCCCREGKKE